MVLQKEWAWIVGRKSSRDREKQLLRLEVMLNVLQAGQVDADEGAHAGALQDSGCREGRAGVACTPGPRDHREAGGREDTERLKGPGRLPSAQEPRACPGPQDCKPQGGRGRLGLRQNPEQGRGQA